MSIYTLYRIAIWLPIAIPAILLLLYTILGLNPSAGVVAEVFMYSLIVGGLPYAVLAAWATSWVGGRSEAEIRRLMVRAPLLMVAVFAPLALVVGVVVDRIGPFVAVAGLGTVIIIPLGYTYVGLALLLRPALGPPTPGRQPR